MTTHQVLRHCQTESSTVGSPRDERIKQSVAQMLGHARAVVLELHAGDQSMATRADIHIRERTSPQHQTSTAAVVLVRCLSHCLHGVAAQIQHRLDDEIAIQVQWRQARIVIPIDHHARWRICREQMPHVLQQLMDVDRFLAGQMPRTEQRIDQRHQSIGFADDDRRVFAHRCDHRAGEPAIARPLAVHRGDF